MRLHRSTGTASRGRQPAAGVVCRQWRSRCRSPRRLRWRRRRRTSSRRSWPSSRSRSRVTPSAPLSRTAVQNAYRRRALAPASDRCRTKSSLANGLRRQHSPRLVRGSERTKASRRHPGVKRRDTAPGRPRPSSGSGVRGVRGGGGDQGQPRRRVRRGTVLTKLQLVLYTSSRRMDHARTLKALACS